MKNNNEKSTMGIIPLPEKEEKKNGKVYRIGQELPILPLKTLEILENLKKELPQKSIEDVPSVENSSETIPEKEDPFKELRKSLEEKRRRAKELDDIFQAKLKEIWPTIYELSETRKLFLEIFRERKKYLDSSSQKASDVLEEALQEIQNAQSERFSKLKEHFSDPSIKGYFEKKKPENKELEKTLVWILSELYPNDTPGNDDPNPSGRVVAKALQKSEQKGLKVLWKSSPPRTIEEIPVQTVSDLIFKVGDQTFSKFQLEKEIEEQGSVRINGQTLKSKKALWSYLDQLQRKEK